MNRDNCEGEILTDPSGRNITFGVFDKSIAAAVVTAILSVGGWMVKGLSDTTASVERLRDGQQSAAELAKSQFNALGKRIDRIENREDHYRESK